MKQNKTSIHIIIKHIRQLNKTNINNNKDSTTTDKQTQIQQTTFKNNKTVIKNMKHIPEHQPHT